jgi:hypothetical protein
MNPKGKDKIVIIPFFALGVYSTATFRYDKFWWEKDLKGSIGKTKSGRTKMFGAMDLIAVFKKDVPEAYHHNILTEFNV